MTEPVDAVVDNLKANIGRLVDEKHTLIAEVGALKTENAELTLANKRLGETAKALIAEKGELQRMNRDERNQLASKICEAIAIEMDKQELFKAFTVQLPGTDVVFIRGLCTG